MKGEIFRLARQILLTEGWVQGYYSLPQGYCVVGACGHAMRTLGLGGGVSDFEYSAHFLPLRAAVEQTVRASQQEFEEYDFEVYRWNDRTFRNLQEVLDVLTLAAEIAEMTA